MEKKIKYLKDDSFEKSRDHFTKTRSQKPTRKDVLEILRKKDSSTKKPVKKIARPKDVEV